MILYCWTGPSAWSHWTERLFVVSSNTLTFLGPLRGTKEIKYGRLYEVWFFQFSVTLSDSNAALKPKLRALPETPNKHIQVNLVNDNTEVPEVLNRNRILTGRIGAVWKGDNIWGMHKLSIYIIYIHSASQTHANTRITIACHRF